MFRIVTLDTPIKIGLVCKIVPEHVLCIHRWFVEYLQKPSTICIPYFILVDMQKMLKYI